MSQEIYNKTVFKRFFEENDPAVMEWAENVLEKVSSPGILPTFIKKDGEDFKAYWETVCHIFALVVLYAKQYNEIDTNKILFELFIENRGLVTDEVNTLEQMKYLFNNYVKEYRKRGTLDIVNKEGTILGELLRLIRYKTEDEFIFALLMSRDTGWTMGHSSPTWNRTDTVLNVTKGYETTESVKDLNAYPLVNPTGVVIVDDIDNNGTPIQAMTFVGNVLVGISSEIDKTKLFPISENLSYQISFKVKTSSTSNQNLKFGVEVFNEAVQPMICKESYGSAESNNFVSGSKGILELPVAEVYYECRAILSRKNRAYAKQLELNFSKGRGLQMKDGMKFLSLSLTQDRSNSSALVYIYDIKIKPLFLPFYQGNLGEKDVIAAYYLNNSLTSEEGVKGFTEDYLVTYKNIMGSEDIQPLKEKNVIFKVLSDRGAYIEGASISILDKRLVTDRNGEASIVLYPGDYSIDVEKSLFMNIEDRLFQVLEDDEETQVEYIQMQGDVYERKVTFVVRDENERPIQNALVTFNGEFKYTDSSGNAIFMAFPGLYPYTVSKTDYYTISKNINVQDDQSEPVTLILIPRYTVTFTVTNSSTGAVEGANVTLTAKDRLTTEDAVAYSESKRTGTNGKVTFTNILGGDYTYLVEKQNWIPVNGDVVVDSNKDIQVSFNPMPTFNMTFTVNDYNTFTGEKKPLNGATVRFAGLTKQTSDNGQAVFEGVLGGKYSYDVFYDNNHQRVYVENYEFYNNSNLTIDLKQLTYKTTIKVYGAGGMVVEGAKVNVNGKDFTQKDSSGIVLELPNGVYTAIASYEEYEDREQQFTVNGAAQVVSIYMDQTLYDLTFVVTEDNGIISNGTRITLNQGGAGEQTGLTNNGQIKFSVPRMRYDWVASKQYFSNQTGVVQPNDLPKTVNVAMPRKETRVQFYVYNSDTGLPVSGASVKPEGLSTQNTGAGSITTFMMQMGKTYRYEVSVYDYQPTEGSVTVNQESMPQQRVGISNKTYSAHITVKSRNGYNINRAYVTYGGKSGYTNSQGQLTLTGIQSGSYNATCTADNYQSQTKNNIAISGADTYIDFTLDYELTTTYIYLRKENVLQPYASVNIRTTAPDGSSYYSGTDQTNGSGRITVSSPSGGYVYASATDSECVGTGDESTNAGGSSIYLYLWKALIVSYSGSPQTPSVSNGVYE